MRGRSIAVFATLELPDHSSFGGGFVYILIYIVFENRNVDNFAPRQRKVG